MARLPGLPVEGPGKEALESPLTLLQEKDSSLSICQTQMVQSYLTITHLKEELPYHFFPAFLYSELRGA